jgi:acyl-coenzyme A thioesterase PaaI-like protein
MYVSPKMMKFLLNIYPPYLGAGIKIEYIKDNWKELKVSMVLRWYNRNAVGTHFGGSLYSMTDPHIMLLLMNILGKDYIIWDKSAEIDFIKATKQKVFCTISISDEIIEEIKQQTEKNAKFLPEFILDIVDSEGNLIAKVKKVLYIRRKNRIKDSA